MNGVALDTHAAATRFRRAGFTEDQVEALVEITRETTASPDISVLATKADLAQLESRMESRFSDVEAKIANSQVTIANSQVQTLTIMTSATAVIVTLATVLSRLIKGSTASS